MVSQITFSNNEVRVVEIEKSLRNQFPDYEFAQVIQSVVDREGRKYFTAPYIVENIYQTSSRLCRTRKVPLTYSVDDEIWTLNEDDVHKGLVYMAAVVDSQKESNCCVKLDFDERFFITEKPISDDAIVKVFDSFSERKEFRSKVMGFLSDKWTNNELTSLMQVIENGRLLSIGVSSFGFFQRTIDYELKLGLSGNSRVFVFHVFFEEGSDLRVRKVERVHRD